MGADLTLVNPAYETALELKALLLRRSFAGRKKRMSRRIYTRSMSSDATEKFQQFAESILPCSVRNTSQINIEEY